ncbi:MAG: CTB family bacteriocin [Brasilonema angustatum HA4187-MV1]|jgi:hypothetical protein|nr:CTB family bacteriocin [Brasilonema angustatum HA4187-MV1]
MSQLFTDLSAAEQEVVAGGIDFGQISQSLYALKTLAAGSQITTTAGPGGAGTTSVNMLQTNSLDTNALNDITAKFPGLS